jgi:arylsulfate sulfotransferase
MVVGHSSSRLPFKKCAVKACSMIIVGIAFIVFSHLARATQADDTTIRITGHTAGATPFISKLTLDVSNTTVLKSIQFAISPKPGSVTRPLSATYANSYLVDRGFENPQTGEVLLPVYGLYDGYNNTVALTYRFMDGSSKRASIRITTATFNDPCGYKNPTVLKARTNNTDLSYDYMMVKGSCSNFSPAIIDTDGALRWVGTARISGGSGTFFDNAVYLGHDHHLTRIDLDGAVTVVGDYSSLGIVNFHHNIDRGKVGMILDADTTTYYNSMVIEADASGRIVKQWNMANIISAAMIAGGDDPSQFVYPTPTDWFHLNGVTYNRADDTLIVSSRENFLICIDYQTNGIRWILGDPTKRWYQFPSLRNFALTLTPGSLPPVGQHAPSITYDQNLLIIDNGQSSVFHMPRGDQRYYAAPRKYRLDLTARTATEIWNFESAQSVPCPYCGSVYEDAPLNYLIDYAFESPNGQNAFARLLGLNAAGETIFSYRYPSYSCSKAYRALPIHLENTKFPTVGPQALNLSTRGLVSVGDNVLIGGFVVSGTDPKTVALRALGPSLSGFGLSNVLRDPVLKLYNSSGALIATNDDWQGDPNHFIVQSNGLVPPNLTESAMARTFTPGAYTVIVRGKDATPGIGLVELYDLSPLSNSTLTNISTRGSVGTGDNVLISGFIIGDVDSATVVVRAIGPSLAAYGVSGVLSDPTLTIYDSRGSAIASNDNWQDNVNSMDIARNGLAPPNALESALVLHLPAGKYTVVVRGANDGTGIGLAEVYTLH